MWNPFAWLSVVLVTRLPPEECHRRLKADLRSGWSFDPTPGGVTGFVGKRWFRLRLFFLLPARNLHAVAAGTLEETGLGTRIRCAMRMTLLVPAAFAGLVFVLAARSVRDNTAENFIGALVFIGCALAFIVYSRWLASDEPQSLTDYLRDLLEAEIER